MTEIIDNRKGKLRQFDFCDFGRRVNSLGLSFALTDDKAAIVYRAPTENYATDFEELVEMCISLLEHGGQGSNGKAIRIGKNFLAIGLNSIEEEGGERCCNGIAVVDIGGIERTELEVAAVKQMLVGLTRTFETQFKASQQVEMVSGELAQVYEELVLLHKLSANMKVTESDCNYLQMACDSLTDIVSVEGIAILLEKETEGSKELIISAGAGLIDIDWHLAGVLQDRLEQEIFKGQEALLDSEIDTPFKYHWPDNIRNIIAVPLIGKSKSSKTESGTNKAEINMIGIMVAINRQERADFDSIDSKLFNSVANGCAVFIENGRLFNDLKELFIGSLKALTNSIDAKDPYTRGHSERVAFISRWIVERLAVVDGNMDEDQIHRVYLAGLLHDVGKMGVTENVLCKKGKLTDEEYSCIKEHPTIGAGILGGIKQMHDIVPGVLCHHERMDGRGYPGGLKGEQVPVIARIISLADSFDAMTSRRTYRDAMNLDKALEQIKEGLGTQFDEQIGMVFLESDIYHLWDLIQDGFKDAYSTEDAAGYGKIAVGTLIR